MEWVYGLEQVSMTVTLSSRLEIPRARFKEKKKVVVDGSTLSINSIHSLDEENNKVKNLRLVKEVIKHKVFNDYLSLVHLTK